MVQRGQINGDTPDNIFVASLLSRLEEFEKNANEATSVDELDDLIEHAEQQAQLRAYICPQKEILEEGALAIDLLDEWNVPKPVIKKLRGLLVPKLEQADVQPDSARSALRAIFDETDSWSEYTNEYEDTMKSYTQWLAVATIVLTLLAILALHWQSMFLDGLLFAGAAGSCASIMAKMPVLDVSLSGELDAYGRRILNRIGVGFIASLIGCALLSWGLIPISIQNQTFADVLNGCTISSAASCTGVKSLILLGIPMLFGFSERALTSFEKRFFGSSKGKGD